VWPANELVKNLLRLASCANPVLEMLMYFARTLRFLRSVFAQPAFARDGFSPGSIIRAFGVV
jgi:hypothetical protein